MKLPSTSILWLSTLFATVLTSDIKSDLTPRLSSGAEVVLPSDSNFPEVSQRWNNLAGPDVAAIVVAAEEDDITNTLSWASDNAHPYLLMNQGHGWGNWTSAPKNLIVVRVDGLNTIDISPSGDSVTLGPGLAVDEVTAALYAAGYEMPTGTCPCAGILGVTLGGGHGRLQGLYGLLADVLISARVLLSNGTVVTASKSKNADLFWGLRGAGHNFGAVLSATYKIFPASNGGQHYNIAISYPDADLEAVLEALNKGLPERASVYVTLNGAREGVLVDYIYAGTKEDAVKARDALLPAGGEVMDEAMRPWDKLNSQSQLGDFVAYCTKGIRKNIYSVSIKKYDLPAARLVLDGMRSFVAANPWATLSSVLLESYPLQGMRAVPAEESAYSNRDVGVIAVATLTYADPANDEAATAWSESVRDILRAKDGFGDKYRTYVNYGRGDEAFGAYYGWESWRREKLVGLKKKWDPEGKFSSYHPIA